MRGVSSPVIFCFWRTSEGGGKEKGAAPGRTQPSRLAAARGRGGRERYHVIGMFFEHTLTLFWLSGLLFAVALTAMHLRAPAWEAAAVVLFKVDILVETIVLLVVVVVYVVCSLSLSLSLSVGCQDEIFFFFFAEAGGRFLPRSVYRTGLGMEPRGSAAMESRGPGVENALLRAAHTISLQKIPDPRGK